jgi:hypothetical protein
MKRLSLAVAVLWSTLGAAQEPYPATLPADAEVRAAMSAAPMVQAAREQLAIGTARQRKLRAGTYEWEVAATSQQRKDPAGISYAEQQYELTRRWRLPGKGTLDRRMGALAVSVGENSFADGWHEAGRSLLAGWFDWQRETQAAALLLTQADLARKQLDDVGKRVGAGDAPRIDQQLAEAELGRVVALQLDAVRRAEAARLNLLQLFPQLTPRPLAQVVEPLPVQGSDEKWIRQIVQENHEIELAQGKADEASVAATRARRDRIADPLIGLQFSNNMDQNRQVVGVRVAIPLGYSNRSADASLARSAAAIAAADADQVRGRVDATARLDLVNARSAYLQWERLASVARQSTAAADSVGRAYTVGELGMSELLAARRQALDAQLLAGAAQLTAHETHARLKLDAHELWALDEGAGH